MALIRHNTFPSLDEFPAGLRVFEDTVNRLLSEPASRPWSPAVDIFETDNELLLKADLPGLDMKDIDIQIENGTLTLKGERRFQNESKEGGFHRVERGYGSFTRYFTLPESVDTEKVSADYKNGVLSVKLPKKEVAKPRQIRVQVS